MKRETVVLTAKTKPDTGKLRGSLLWLNWLYRRAGVPGQLTYRLTTWVYFFLALM